MLVLARKMLERIRLRVNGQNIWLQLVDHDHQRVRIAFDADKSVEIMREELLDMSERYAAVNGTAQRE